MLSYSYLFVSTATKSSVLQMLNRMWWTWMAVCALAACVNSFVIMQPHPTRCDLFYQLDLCPPGLQFNADAQMCDLPSRANCAMGLSPRSAVQSPMQMVLVYPHPSSCEFYYRLHFCPSGLHFNPTRLACDFPQSAGCNAECATLGSGPGMTISPTTCITGNTKMGGSCTFSCAQGYQLKGSERVTCTASGWNSTQGLNIIPACLTPTEIVQDVVNNIDQEIKGVNASLLFVMDESGSITKEHFPKEVHFIQALVSAFPLSERRSAGVILFSDKTSVEISVKTSDTCTFLKEADKIVYHSGGTDILLALNAANNEISRNGVHKKNLVLLITDGQSADPTAEADILKNNGNVLFTIGVAGYDRNILESIASVGKRGDKLFYGITDFAAFDEVARHLETTYLNGTKHNCP